MTWLAPGFMAAGVVAALGVVLLHLIALQRPRRYLLPTARFVPSAAARAASLTRRPTDPWLLLLRALTMLLLGAAFARPVLTSSRVPVRQVVVVDGTNAVASSAELRDSVTAHVATGDVVILFDSTTRPVGPAAVDSLASRPLVDARGSLTSALIAARRAATALADSTDSVRVVVISPFVRETVDDAALLPVRAGWPGTLELVRVAAETTHASNVAIELPDDEDDALVAGARIAGIVTSVPSRLARDGVVDSAWVREGGLLLMWPSSLPEGWTERVAPDTMGAVVADGHVVVAPFVRRWSAPDAGIVAARWVDGVPAAVESTLGKGCVRTVGVPLPASGDLTLRPEFGDLLRALAAPCGGRRALLPIPAAALDSLARGVDDSAINSSTVSVASLRRVANDAPLTRWLLAAVLVLLLLEWILRGRLGGAHEERGVLREDDVARYANATARGADHRGSTGREIA